MPPDSGPFYAETNWDNFFKEPWNGVTAFAFFLIAIVWMVRLRKDASRHRFTMACLALLLIGGVGGTIFHLFRASRFFLVMDFLPIILIAVALSFRLWHRFAGSWLPAIFASLVFFFLQRGIRMVFPFRFGINLSYLLTALYIAVPLVLVLRRDRWREAKTVGAAAGFFVVGLFFRASDLTSPEWLPMGTHWLWHLFSAAGVWFLITYLVELESRKA